MEIVRDTPLKEVLKLTPACSCDDCNHGCKFGSGYFVDGQLEKLSEYMKINFDVLKKKYLTEERMLNRVMFRPKRKRENGKMPFGECIFFDSVKERCKIHSVKPLQCQIAMGCKEYGEEVMTWFMSNYVLDEKDNESIREYDTYIKTGGKILKGGKLKDIISDKKKLDKILKREI